MIQPVGAAGQSLIYSRLLPTSASRKGSTLSISFLNYSAVFSLVTIRSGSESPHAAAPSSSVKGNDNGGPDLRPPPPCWKGEYMEMKQETDKKRK